MRQSRAPTVGATLCDNVKRNTDLCIGVADSESPSSLVLDEERPLLWQGQHWYVRRHKTGAKGY